MSRLFRGSPFAFALVGLWGCGASTVAPDAGGVVSTGGDAASSGSDADAAVDMSGARGRRDGGPVIFLDGFQTLDAAGAVDAAAPVDLSLPTPTVDQAMAPPPDLSRAPSADLAGAPVDMAAPTASDMAVAHVVDMAAPPASDMAAPPAFDLAMAPHDLAAPPADLTMKPVDMAQSSSGGDMAYVPPGSTDTPIQHAAPTPIALSSLAGTSGVLDVGADDGGGVWAVSSSTAYFWPHLSSSPFTYTAASGLARGSKNNPLASVGGGRYGQAVVGNRGAIADALAVDPSSGAIVSLQNMSISCSPSMTNYAECLEQQQRVVAGIRVAANTNGVFDGTAYIGGTHGTTAWHGLDGSCGCLQFQQHVHYIPPSGCDSTVPQNGCWSGDVFGLAFTPQGDLWIGDEHFVALLPQGSLGSSVDFFQNFTVAVDVFPGVNDEVHALSVDGAGGVWVASYGNGAAYLAPSSYTPSFYDRSRELPMNRLTAVAVDTDGSVWFGTDGGGIARKSGSSWIYYTAASGLRSDNISSLFIDKKQSPRRVLIGTDVGVSVYTGP